MRGLIVEAMEVVDKRVLSALVAVCRGAGRKRLDARSEISFGRLPLKIGLSQGCDGGSS